MSSSLIKDHSLNCFQTVITSLAVQQGISKEEIWYQCGLYFDIKDGINFLLDPKYKTIHSQFKNDINFYSQDYALLDKCIESVDKLLVSHGPVALTVDAFELDYTVSYKNLNLDHFIEVYEKEGEAYKIFDHYYHFEGKITRENLVKAMESYQANFNNAILQLYFIKAKVNFKGLTQKEILLIVAENYNAMLGIRTIKNKDLKGYFGIQGLPPLKDRLLLTIRDGDNKEYEQFEDEIGHWFNSLKDFSNSRLNFYRLLEKHIPSHDTSFLITASHSWSSLSNMLLKGLHTNKLTQMYDRIEKKFNKIIQCEHDNLVKLNTLIVDLERNLNE